MDNNAIVAGFDEEKDDSLQIRLQTIKEIEKGLILYLTGYIDTYNSNLFQKRVTKAVGARVYQADFQLWRAELRIQHGNWFFYRFSEGCETPRRGLGSLGNPTQGLRGFSTFGVFPVFQY